MSLWTRILYKLHNQLERERTNYSVSCQLEIVNSQHILEQCDTNRKKKQKNSRTQRRKEIKRILSFNNVKHSKPWKFYTRYGEFFAYLKTMQSQQLSRYPTRVGKLKSITLLGGYQTIYHLHITLGILCYSYFVLWKTAVLVTFSKK